MSDFPTCEVCGGGWEFGITMTSSNTDGLLIRCDMCSRLVDSGLYRLEIDERGKRRYRQWHIQPMTPGDLLPKVSS